MNSASAALFEEHANFRRREADAASFLGSSAKRKKTEKSSSSSQKTNRPKSTFGRSKTSTCFPNDYHTSSSSSQSRFLILAKIVEKLKDCFLGGTTDAIALDEIIQESELIIESSDKHWLASEALLSNEKIDVKKVEGINKFVYKSPLNLKDGKKQTLLNLLKNRHEKCEGAVTIDDVRDTISREKADKIIENLIKDGQVVKLKVHPDFTESWRKTSVEGLDDKKIWEFLDKQGYYGLMKNTPRQSHLTNKPRRGGRRPDTMKHNQHVAHKLEDYSEPSAKK
ncbi:unnamed protein product [Rotaria socialis]|uniref:Transcription initiation factor IIE subunit beta n=1 Tax=Rotaria socialis TaxID=392032 RepID=A0A821JAT9_9BILA|nr:unnamed protein product [Rotaria socialis]